MKTIDELLAESEKLERRRHKIIIFLLGFAIGLLIYIAQKG